MNKLVLLLLLLLFPMVSHAADHCIRADAGGNDDGTDWTNAWTDLPATLTRGDTYYFADGEYANFQYDFDDAESGTDYIYIKKATAAAHGTETGWDSGYGDGQATILDNAWHMRFQTGYYVVDGVTGAGMDSTAYGFKFSYTGACDDGWTMIGAPGVGQGEYQLDHITIQYCAFVGPGESCGSGAYAQQGIYGYPDSGKEARDMTVQYCYFVDLNHHLFAIRWEDSLIQYNIFAENWSSASKHGDKIAFTLCDSVVLKNNIIYGEEGSTLLKFNQVSNIDIYNNIVWGDSTIDYSAGFNAPGSSDDDGVDDVKNLQLHHNTFININFGTNSTLRSGKDDEVTDNPSYVYNNLFYNCLNIAFVQATCESVYYDYNVYYDGDPDSLAANDISASGDPFVNWENGDYTLNDVTGADAINAGTDLGDDYDDDYNGTDRDDYTPWDIGAFEFTDTGGTSGSGSGDFNIDGLGGSSPVDGLTGDIDGIKRP